MRGPGRGAPAAFLVSLCLLATPASAQEPPAATAGLRPPRWDILATAGYFLTPYDAEDSTSRFGSSRLEFQVDLGRYWTTHLRTDVGFSPTTEDDGYNWEDLPGFGLVSFDRLTRLYAIPAAVSYRPFEDNVFVHPYLSGGIRVGVLSQHLYRYQTFAAFQQGRTVSTRSTSVVALPFVAAGLTRSVRGRFFERSEVLVAFDSGGVAHVTARAGFGVYF